MYSLLSIVLNFCMTRFVFESLCGVLISSIVNVCCVLVVAAAAAAAADAAATAAIITAIPVGRLAD